MKPKGIEVKVFYRKFLNRYCEVVSGMGGGWRTVNVPDISRPGLLLAGFEEEFPSERIQIIGITERAYLIKHPDKAEDSIKRLYTKEPPAVIITSFNEKNNESITNLFSYYGEKFAVPTFSSALTTSRIISLLMDRLQYELAPTVYEHGVMVDVFGVGILLKGKSAIGKSECAVELIRRGHRFIADDMVSIKLYPADNLIAEPPREDLKFFLEIKGVGIVHVPSIYGFQVVKENTRLDCIVEFIPSEDFVYNPDAEIESVEYFSIKVPKFKLPITPGKNMASLVEAVALVYKSGDLKSSKFKSDLIKTILQSK